MRDDNTAPSIRLAIVCPMANEADSAEDFVRDVLSYSRPAAREVTLLVICDKKSRDGTLELMRRMSGEAGELRLIYAPEARGVVDAYWRGYREALAGGADWILEMDAGYSHLPSEIPRFLEAAKADCDCVFATRFSQGGAYLGGIGRRYLISRVGGWLTRKLLGLKVSDPTSGFQLFSNAALRRITDGRLRSRGPFFQVEIKARLRDLRIKEVPISYRPTGQFLRPAAVFDALRVLFMLAWQRRFAGCSRPAVPAP